MEVGALQADRLFGILERMCKRLFLTISSFQCILIPDFTFMRLEQRIARMTTTFVPKIGKIVTAD